jgi:phosphodiesterase/alkaline phosphatase D-like protein
MKLSSILINRCLVLCAVVVGLCGNAQAWTTETFDNLGLSDCETRGNGVTLGNYKYYSSNGSGVLYDKANSLGSGGSGAIQRNWNSMDATWLSFTRSDRSVFSLKQIFVWDTNHGGSASNTLKAFRNGVQVYSNPSINAFDSATKVLNWTNIDSVVILDSPDLYSNIDNIMWEAYVTPTAATGTKSGVSSSGATISGTVNANNTTTSDSIQYGLTTSYGTTVVASPPTATGSSATSISATLSGLLASSTYHYRVKATNLAGSVYGLDSTFTTLASPPSATTNAATGVGSTAVTLNGSANANGVSTAVTFQYGATTSYGTTVTAGQSPVTGSSATAVSVALSGLTPSTTYHYRVVGVNGGGTTNGGDLTFTTSGAAPTAATGTKSGVSSTGATVSGTVNANNANTTDSVRYGTTASYGTTVVATPATATGTSGTSISAILGGLTPNTTYHYQVKAVNATGTSYGDDSTFTTSAIVPTATTGAASSITGTGAAIAGTVNANNASTTDSASYGLTTSYGTAVVASPATSTGISATSISATLSGLTPNTTYHYQVKAVNVAGASYGADQTFTTSAIAPTVTTGTKSSVGSASAKVSGTANANNSNTTDSVQYGTTASYGTTVVATPATATGTIATSISATLSGLTANTTYHYRVKAVNAAGTSYGFDSTFTTTLLPQTITFGALTSQTYGTDFVKLAAAASSGLPVNYASANSAAVRISNDTAYLLAADTATITASQSGSASYLEAASVSQIMTVTKKGLTITGAVASSKVYDGTVSASVTGSTLSGKVGVDDVTLVLGTASFATKDTGTAKAVTVTGSSLFGAGVGNYSLTEVSGLTANIVPDTITVTADAKSKVEGMADPALTYTTNKALLGTDTWTGALMRDEGTAEGDYPIRLGSLSAGGNYAITFVGANLTITHTTGLAIKPVRTSTSRDLGANIGHAFAFATQGHGAARLGSSACTDVNSCLSVDIVLPDAATVSVAIFDNLGSSVIAFDQSVSKQDFKRLAATVDGRRILPVSWNLRASRGAPAPSGVYLWKILVVTEDGRKLETVKKLGVR